MLNFSMAYVIIFFRTALFLWILGDREDFQSSKSIAENAFGFAR